MQDFSKQGKLVVSFVKFQRKCLHGRCRLKWRLKKFSENKATLLIDRILQDKGQPDLSGTVERLRNDLRAGGSGVDEGDGPAERGLGARADGTNGASEPGLSAAGGNLGGRGGDQDMSDDEDDPSSKPPATSAG